MKRNCIHAGSGDNVVIPPGITRFTSVMWPLLLVGCSANLSMSVPALTSIHGTVNIRQQPVANAQVQLFSVAAQAASASAKMGDPVVTDSKGSFVLTRLPQCPSEDALVYVVARGGEPQSSNGVENPSLTLMSTLGTCGTLTSETASNVNELTTVASASPLAPYAAGESFKPASGTDLPGIAATTIGFVNPASGTAPGVGVNVVDANTVAKINTLGNMLVACASSNGGSAGDGSPCGQLFSLAAGPSSAPPADTLAAVISIAQNPTHNVDSLYSLSLPVTAFQPALSAQPSDLSLITPAALQVQLSPASVTLGPSATQLFNARVVHGNNPAVTWTISPAVGSISQSGTYTAPATVGTAQTVTVTAQSVEDSTKLATATVSLVPPVSIAISTQGSTTLLPSASTLFSATVANTTNTAVTWSINPAVGTISSNGLYTAPTLINNSQVVTVTAQSVADPTKAVTALVTLNPPSIFGNTYYVDNVHGRDTNPGTSPAQAFATVAKVNTLPLLPGQTVAFAAGEEWHETLNLTRSGIAGAPITLTSFGSGAQPIISAADNVTGWSKANATNMAPQPCAQSDFCSGFESSSFGDFDSAPKSEGDASMVVTKAQHYDGGSSVAISSSNGQSSQAWLTKTIPAIQPAQMYVARFYVYVPTGSLGANTGQTIFQVGSPDKPLELELRTNNEGNVSAILAVETGQNSSYPIIAPLVPSFQMDAWNEIEMDFSAAAATTTNLFVNGAQVINLSQNQSTADLIGARTIQVGASLAANALNPGGTLYMDTLFFGASQTPVGPYTPPSSPYLWQRTQTGNPYLLNFAGQPGTSVPSAAAINQAGQFAWNGATLSVYSLDDPTSSVEIPQRPWPVILSGASNITINNLEIRGAQSSNIYCTTALGCPGLVVNNVTSRAAYTDGLEASSGDISIAGNITIINSNFNGLGGAAVALTGSMASGATIGKFENGNSITNVCTVYTGQVTAIASYWTNDNIYCDAIKTYSNNNLAGTGTSIAYNNIKNVGVGQPQSYGGGIHFDTTTGGVIEHNTIQNTNGPGLQLEKTVGGALAQYNLIVNGGTATYSSGIFVRAGDGENTSGATVQYNTAYGGWWACAFLVQQNQGLATASNTTFQKNICNGGTSNTDLYADPGALSSGNTWFDNSFGVANPYFIVFGGNVLSSYSGLDQLVGETTNSVQGDPMFNNPSAGDFTLKANSPARGIGAFPTP